MTASTHNFLKLCSSRAQKRFHRLFSPWTRASSRNLSSGSSPFAAPFSLHYETIGSSENSESSTVFLHGLLGHGRNLKTFAKQICSAKNSSGYLVDLRGHGKSRLRNSRETTDGTTSASVEHHTFSACANDLSHTLSTEVFPELSSKAANSILVGHSWGGRMALEYMSANLNGSNSINRVWLLDTVPGRANANVEKVLKAISELTGGNLSPSPTVFEKKELIRLLTEGKGIDIATSQWLASSYSPKTRDFGFDFDVVEGIFPEFATQDFEGQLTSLLERDIRVDLVRGGKNGDWDVSILNRLQLIQKSFPRLFDVHTLPKAGHWVHIDDQKGLVDLMTKY